MAAVFTSAPRAPGKSFQGSGRNAGGFRPNSKEAKPKVEPKTLFQTYFKSVGPRTYAAQVKEAGNGNHFIVLTEGKRDAKTDEVRKTRLYIFSEDFDAFRDLLRDTFTFVRDHPVSKEVADKQKRFWAKKARGPKGESRGPKA